jgi:hypothetical protein
MSLADGLLASREGLCSAEVARGPGKLFHLLTFSSQLSIAQ